jgi:hypothetical protein
MSGFHAPKSRATAGLQQWIGKNTGWRAGRAPVTFREDPLSGGVTLVRAGVPEDRTRQMNRVLGKISDNQEQEKFQENL